MPLGVIALFGDVVLKGTALLVVALILARALRNAPAAARHLVWSAALVGMLVIPALSRTMPWNLEVLPAIESTGLVDAPSSDLATNADEAEALGGGVPVAVAADTDQARMPLGGLLKGPLETEGATGATKGKSWQIPAARQLLSWVTLIWLLGVGVLSVRIAISFVAIRWMAWRGASADPADWDGELDAARSVLGLTIPVRLVVSRLASMPFTIGIWSPVIVLPASSVAWDRARRRAVLLHELSHIRRWDVLTHFVSQAACALYWFHPLAWVAAKRLRVECERACDDLVLNSGERPTDYAEQVLSIVREASQRRTPALALPMARHAGLEERLSAILEFDGCLRTLSRRGAGMIVATMILTVVPLSALAPNPCDSGSMAARDAACTISPDVGAERSEVSVTLDRLEIRAPATTDAPLSAPDRQRESLDADAVVSMPVSAGEAQVRQVLQASALCPDQPDAAIATFEDATLEAAVRAALSIGAQDDLTCGLVSGLTALDAEGAGIESLLGIQNLTSLTELRLAGNSITDISAVSGLTSLTVLDLSDNEVTDFSAVGGLTNLTSLRLEAGEQALIRAAGDGHADIVTLLLANGADANSTDVIGGTALMYAAGDGFADVVSMLLTNGANANSANVAGGTALIYASGDGFADVVSLLLANGADANLTDIRGATALVYASGDGFADVVELLLANGADVN